ncbi:hypothetical protein L6164_018468 [Bauhinia variegata]|uniref:Uncharacterized protein n=1 Tax=Bauhinia variegata TaxID=167791 RepID=A0ACB9NDC0_BAUVA|nr:hypothetical protein L6164_018468 [Bauhinia variegata]
MLIYGRGCMDTRGYYAQNLCRRGAICSRVSVRELHARTCSTTKTENRVGICEQAKGKHFAKLRETMKFRAPGFLRPCTDALEREIFKSLLL